MTPAPHHVTMVWSPAYEVDIGAHVFPTAKYRLVKERLLGEGVVRPEQLVEAVPATDEELARVHTPEYLRKVREGDFTPEERWLLEIPFSPGVRDASIVCCGGSILAGRRALEGCAAVHLGGGFHHAFPDHGEGFCVLNDVAVAVRTLQADGSIQRAAVVDLDVHHGNGTAAVFAGDSTVFTFSMHQQRNYPAMKPPGDLDVGLADGVGDDEYLRLLAGALPRVMEHRPGLVAYLAGADPYREDVLGGLGLSREGLRARDRMVLEACHAAGVPVAVVLAGGYAARREDTVAIHCATVAAAVDLAGPGSS